MKETKNMKVEFIDDTHIFVGNKQYVSLQYLAETRVNAEQYHNNEIKTLCSKVQDLSEENEALRVLLKNKLNEQSED